MFFIKKHIFYKIFWKPFFLAEPSKIWYLLHMLRKSFISLLIVSFVATLVVTPHGHAAPLLSLPEPGKMVNLSMAYNPAIIKGVTVNKDNPFLFDFIVDPGQDALQGDALKQEGEKQIRYFLAALTVPAKDLWVNLSPYEKDRTINEALGQTDMGRDLLAQDYILKQLTASLIYPEKELGKTFWNKVYAKTQAKFGDVQIPVNTFNKVWIMADQAEVYEHNQTAFVTKSHLKVLLDTDYLAQQKNEKLSPQNDKLSPPKSFIGGPGKAVSGFPIQALGNDKENISSQIIREVILPELEREVNEGKNFAPLRQIFNSIILAGWYKNNLQSSLLNQTYADKSTVNGIDLADQKIKEKIYNRYLEAYKKGVFNYVKEDATDKTPRKYFSGGVDAAMAGNPTIVKVMTSDAAMAIQGTTLFQKISAGLSNALRPNVSTAPLSAVELEKIAYDLIGKNEPIKNIVGFRKLGNALKLLFDQNPLELVTPDMFRGFVKNVLRFRDSLTQADRIEFEEIDQFLNNLRRSFESEIIIKKKYAEGSIENLERKYFQAFLAYFDRKMSEKADFVQSSAPGPLNSQDDWQQTDPDKIDGIVVVPREETMIDGVTEILRQGNPAMTVTRMDRIAMLKLVKLALDYLSDPKKVRDVEGVNKSGSYDAQAINTIVSFLGNLEYIMNFSSDFEEKVRFVDELEQFLSAYTQNGADIVLKDGSKAPSEVALLIISLIYAMEHVKNSDEQLQAKTTPEFNEWLVTRPGDQAMAITSEKGAHDRDRIAESIMKHIIEEKNFVNDSDLVSALQKYNNGVKYNPVILESAATHIYFLKYYLDQRNANDIDHQAALQGPQNQALDFLKLIASEGTSRVVYDDPSDTTKSRKLSPIEDDLVSEIYRLLEAVVIENIDVFEFQDDQITTVALDSDQGKLIFNSTEPAPLSDAAMTFNDLGKRIIARMGGVPFIASKEDAVTVLSGPVKVQKDFKQYKSAIIKLVQEEPSWFLKKGNSGQVNFDKAIRKIKPGRVQGISQNEIEKFLEELRRTIKAAIIVLQQENKNFSRIRNLQFLLGKVEAIIQSGIDSSRGDLGDRGSERLLKSVDVREFNLTQPPDLAMTNVQDTVDLKSFVPQPVGLTTPKEVIDDIANFRLPKENVLDFTTKEWEDIEVLISLESRSIRNNKFTRQNLFNRPIDQMLRTLIILTKQPTRNNVERVASYLEIWEGVFISDDPTIERKVLQVVKNMTSQYKSIINAFDAILVENSGESFSLFEKNIIFEYLKGLVVFPNTVKLSEDMERKVNSSAVIQNGNIINSERRLGTARLIIKTIIEIRKQGMRFEISDEVKALNDKMSRNAFENKLLNIMRILLKAQVVDKYKKIISQENSALLWFDENIALSDTLKSMGYSDNLGEFQNQMKDLFNYVEALIDFDSLPISQLRRADNNRTLKDVEYDLRILATYYIRNTAKYSNQPLWDNIFEEIKKWLERVRHTETLREQLKTLSTPVETDLPFESRPDAVLFANTPLTKASNQVMPTQGGIDLKQTLENTAVTKDGLGVQMQLDPAMLQRIKREGIQSLTPVIYQIAPVGNIWDLLGLTPPIPEENRLAGA